MLKIFFLEYIIIYFAQVHHDVSQPMIHTLSDQVDGGKMRHAVIRSENIYFSNVLQGQ
jgi:hypothetical protein